MTTALSDERREAILAAATHIFADKGYANATMDDVAQAIGYTKPVIYDHFKGKEDLYIEIIRITSQRLRQLLNEAVAAEADGRKKVEAAFRVYFNLVVRKSEVFRLLFLQSGPPETENQLRTVEVDLVSFIEPLLTEGLNAEHRREIAGAVVGMAEGAAVVWLVRYARGEASNDASEGEKLAARIATLAWGGLRSVTP